MSTYIPPHKRNRTNDNQPPQQQRTSSSFRSAPRETSYNHETGLPQRNSRWGDSGSDRGYSGFGNSRNSRAPRDPRDAYVDGLLPRNTDREREFFKDARIPEEGIDFTAYDDIPVETEGVDLPEPLEKFADIDMGPVVMNNLTLSGFTVPTPIQKHSLPIILDGHDMMACAQTGSGKTAAFLLPMISHLINEMENIDPFRHNRNSVPKVLILAPTRELAVQIYNAARKFSYRSHLRTVCVYGGASFSKQSDQICRGCDILVGTPGRLIDMVRKQLVDLSEVKFLCIDEADRMLDMGFEDQIKEIIYDLGMPTTEFRQTLMFSATFPVPIQRLAEDFLKEYAFVQVGELGVSTHLVTQKMLFVEERDKYEVLKEVIGQIEGKTLIFCATKSGADTLDEFLYKDGYKSAVIHGDRSQYERMQALDYFKDGKCQILVATDVASRGIHISDIAHVINFDLPSNVQDYVHRIGRTGRCGQEGYATGFFNYDNMNICRDLIEQLKNSGQETPEWLLKISNQSRKKKGGRGGRNGGYNNRGGNNRYGGNSSGGYGGGYGNGGNNRYNSSGSGRYGNSGGYGQSNYSNWDSRSYQY